MKLNLAELQRKLLAAARHETPAEAVPYAFEQRMMARLLAARAREERGAWAIWIRPLWSAAAACSLIALLTGAWSFALGGGTSSVDHSQDPTFSQDLEQTILDADEEGDINW